MEPSSASVFNPHLIREAYGVALSIVGTFTGDFKLFIVEFMA